MSQRKRFKKLFVKDQNRYLIFYHAWTCTNILQKLPFSSYVYMKGGDMVEKSNLALSEGPGFENPHYYGTDIPYVEHHTGSRVSCVIYIYFFWNAVLCTHIDKNKNN